MKKTCGKCKALVHHLNLKFCDLGHETKNGGPVEECPKPTTLQEWADIYITRRLK
jgi:hypothetical protein